ncbi:hypothetical protein AGMMS49975_18030 [Clostridia bacterium]|nr:hypothetical protein AGMMS49975_18030 [Clostridia bacterium]
MPVSPFHAVLNATELTRYACNKDRLIPALSAANIEVYPFQVAAAMFALRSPYLKGAVLADEGSLGKTIEALLVISELWLEGKEKILLVVPTQLLPQWTGILDRHFSIPYGIADKENPDFDRPEIILTTYDFAYANAEKIGKTAWDAAAFDEAHRLSKCYEKDSRPANLKGAVGNAYKLLITASPMRNSIMDLYGLVSFIDDTIFGNPDDFYIRYFRKPENYCELSDRAAYYCFRTLRSQVTNYVKIPKRLVATANFKLSKQECELSKLLARYLSKEDKTAFPKMDKWELTLMLNRALSSSAAAFSHMLETAISRVAEPELIEMNNLAKEIENTSKGKELLKALKLGFSELRKHGANKKALIFTENRETQKYLFDLLSANNYNAVIYDETAIDKFKETAEILIATDVASEGFNLEFCSFVINFDIPYNTQTLEQRIMRCHRQGQQNDVVVLNFLCKDNIADVRTLELINKRVTQFDGIVGGSDNVSGNFSENAVTALTEVFGETRTKSDIDKEYKSTLTENADANEALVSDTENALFTTFTKEISQKTAVSPKYLIEKTDEINDKLWELTKYFFTGKRGFMLNDESRTLRVGITPQKVFTGAYLRRREYSIADKTLTVTSSICRNIINEIFWKGTPDSGTVYADIDFNAEIGYYKIDVGRFFYYTFVGERDGKPLTDSECRELMNLPVSKFTANPQTYGGCDGITKTQPAHRFDDKIDADEFIRRAATENDSGIKDEIKRIQDNARIAKNNLSRDVERLRRVVKQFDQTLSGGLEINERVDAEKNRADAVREMKQKEQSVFMDSCRIDATAEDEIKRLTADISVMTSRYFTIKFIGVSDNGR